MRRYDPRQPLIVIHIPKAAGSTTRKIFKRWFGPGFLWHYYSEKNGGPPPKYDVFTLHTSKTPVVVYGHFYKDKGFGVEDYYPEVKQFITILRDPFESAISNYYYARKTAGNWLGQPRNLDLSLENYLKRFKPYMLSHFPKEISLDNYKDIIEEYFIAIGITEYLDTSMKIIARKLGMPYNSTMLGRDNVTNRDQVISDSLRYAFIEIHRLEYEIYYYAMKKFIEY